MLPSTPPTDGRYIGIFLKRKERKSFFFDLGSASPSKQITPSSHEAVHQDAGDAGRDGGDLDPTVSLHIDVVHRLPCLLAVHCKDGAAAVGGQGWRVQVSQVSCAYSTKKIYCKMVINPLLTKYGTFEPSELLHLGHPR